MADTYSVMVTTMRLLMLGVIVCVVTPAAGAAGSAQSAAAVVLSDLTHALEGATLVISGSVRNRAAAPVARLVVDASGFSPSGDLVAFGSDGIPWEIPSGGEEQFTVRLPLGSQLVRDYVVRVALTRAPLAPLAAVRRSVRLELYRPFILSRVRVSGDASPGVLIVRSDVGLLPVTEVTAEATVILVQKEIDLLERLALTIPANGRRMVALGGRDLVLVDVRLIDVLLSSNWGD